MRLLHHVSEVASECRRLRGVLEDQVRERLLAGEVMDRQPIDGVTVESASGGWDHQAALSLVGQLEDRGMLPRGSRETATRVKRTEEIDARHAQALVAALRAAGHQQEALDLDGQRRPRRIRTTETTR